MTPTKPEDALVERLRSFTATPDWVKAPWRDGYTEQRRKEIDSFIWSITRPLESKAAAWPLVYVAQMLSTISTFSPPQGSHHHATALASETVAFYADTITTLLERERRLTEEAKELRAERDALLQKPIDLAKLDSIDDDSGVPEKMVAYYWWQQAQEARAALTGMDK